jgi:CheY-like chemotaxis protein
MLNKPIDIILVEDSTDDAMLIERAFKSREIRNSIFHLKNGQEALDFIFNNISFSGVTYVPHPKVILLDLNMPKIGGLDVLKRLKRDVEKKFIPVVILTSSAEHPDIKACYAEGANSYVVKPVEFNDFMNVVSSIGVYWSALNKT